MNARQRLWISIAATTLLAAATNAQEIDPPDVTHEESELEAVLEDPVDAPHAGT